ncbi:hypothetical protein FLA_1673 [Filimonas lacunae]|nr:hypothetical protein FLA_1673 [Filimonas lacunae]
MQELLKRMETEPAEKMRRELEESHDRFMLQLAAARESVSIYEKQYKIARSMLAKAHKEQRKAEISENMDNGG